MLTVAQPHRLRVLMCAGNISVPVSSDASCQAPTFKKIYFPRSLSRPIVLFTYIFRINFEKSLILL